VFPVRLLVRRRQTARCHSPITAPHRSLTVRRFFQHSWMQEKRVVVVVVVVVVVTLTVQVTNCHCWNKLWRLTCSIFPVLARCSLGRRFGRTFCTLVVPKRLYLPARLHGVVNQNTETYDDDDIVVESGAL